MDQFVVPGKGFSNRLMNNGKICVPVCGETFEELKEQIERAAQLADVVEIRFDCLGETEVQTAIRSLPTIDRLYLITFRPQEQGGRRPLTMAERLKFWEDLPSQLHQKEALVDVEYDLPPMPMFDPKQTIISAHDFQNPLPNSNVPVEPIFQVPGSIVKIAASAAEACDAIPVWSLLERANSEACKVIPIAMGEAGKWTRILGPAHGAFLTYASLETGSETAPGQISASDMIDIFRIRELDVSTGVFGIIAGNTSYSVSPYLHNAAFKASGVNSVFVPLQTNDLDEFVRRMVKPATREVELNFKGFSVTNPHKQAVIKYLDRIDAAAREIGAVNTIKIEGDDLHGYNTDAEGFIGPLRQRLGVLAGSRVALVGAGGAARACLYSLKNERADTTLFARNVDKGKELANQFENEVRQLDGASDAFSGFDIIVNATPLGTKGDRVNETIARGDQIKKVKLVYDLNYNPTETFLIREAKSAGVETLGGLDMLIAQGARQFQIWTGRDAPIDEMTIAVRKRLGL